jgi:hypothetical protein
MAKKKSLAQLQIGSKKWDEEMLRQEPDWGRRHAEAGRIDARFKISDDRFKRLVGQNGTTSDLDRLTLPLDLSC